MAFYCTESIEMASEWAVSGRQNGFLNKYVLNASDLSELKKMGKEYILWHFRISYQSYDVIRGYRADDSYLSFANKQFACEKTNPLQGTYLIDIMRASWENEDERIQRIIFGGCN